MWLLLQMSRITVLPSHSCGGTLQNLDIKLLHSSMQTSADHRIRWRHVSHMTDERVRLGLPLEWLYRLQILLDYGPCYMPLTEDLAQLKRLQVNVIRSALPSLCDCVVAHSRI